MQIVYFISVDYPSDSEFFDFEFWYKIYENFYSKIEYCGCCMYYTQFSQSSY